MRVRKIIPSNSAIQCKNCMKYSYHIDIYKDKKPRCSVCSKEYTTREYRYLIKDCEGSKNFRQDCCQIQRVIYKYYHCALSHTTTSQDCPVKKAKNLKQREANKAKHQYRLKEANINI